VEERAFLSKISIRGRVSQASFVTYFRNVLGVEPPRPGSAVEADAAIVLPIGPTEWLALERRHDPNAGRIEGGLLRERLAAAGLVAIDLSCGLTALSVAGPGLHPTLRKLAALQLERMPAGSVTRTRIGKLPIVVSVLGPDRLDLLVARSCAQSFLEQLRDAADLRP
jgi:heterotetrameric sarcosine oxidase gamma subunit